MNTNSFITSAAHPGFRTEEEATHELITYRGAQYTELTEKQDGKTRPQRGGGTRGKSSEVFTKRQRRTMETKLAKLNLKKPFHSFTLTYAPDFDTYPEVGFPTDPSTYRNHLDLWYSRLKYRFEVGFVWRLEFQKGRGAPHFHGVIYGLGHLETERVNAVLTELWAAVTGAPAPHESLVDVACPDTVRDRQAVFGYIAKRRPAQLKSPHIEHRKRFWGTKGRINLPEAQPVKRDLTPSEAIRARRAMQKYRDKTSKYPIGANPHNPTLRLRRGRADEWQRFGEWVVGDREYVNPQTGEVRTHRELQENQTTPKPSKLYENLELSEESEIKEPSKMKGDVDLAQGHAELLLPGTLAARFETKQSAPDPGSNAAAFELSFERAAEALKRTAKSMLHDTMQTALGESSGGVEGLSIFGDREEKRRRALRTPFEPGCNSAARTIHEIQRATPRTGHSKRSDISRNMGGLKRANFAGLQTASVSKGYKRRIARAVPLVAANPLIPP